MNPIINDKGSKFWYNEKGQRHREDGPAVEFGSGTQAWYMNGFIHRIDGPAVINYNGDKRWFYYGERIYCSSQEEFERIIKLRIFW